MRFRHYDQHLTKDVSFIPNNKVSRQYPCFVDGETEAQRITNTSFAKLVNGESGFESRFAQLSSSFYYTILPPLGIGKKDTATHVYWLTHWLHYRVSSRSLTIRKLEAGCGILELEREKEVRSLH